MYSLKIIVTLIKTLIRSLLIITCLSLFTFNVVASTNYIPRKFPAKFIPGFDCSDTKRICVSRGTRIIEGFKITRDCWDYAYVKTCKIKSKNDCETLRHCYWIGDIKCLKRDRYGNCVNVKKEFNCKTWQPIIKKNEYGVTKFKDKVGQESLVCRGVPCLDGNCLDKSYMTNGEIMDSLSKLATISQMKTDKYYNVSLFEGRARHCTKKVTSYSNCCREEGKGWGKKLGARCSKDEQLLAELRGKNLCVYVGKHKKGRAKTVVKHRYCCFANLLEKIVQEQGRRQIGKSFGTGKSADCSGLTLAEIQRIDFSRIDFSEFIEDVKKQFAVGSRKIPDIDEIKKRFENSVGEMQQRDSNKDTKDNQRTGFR